MLLLAPGPLTVVRVLCWAGVARVVRENLQKTQPPSGSHKYNFFPVMKARVPKDLTELETSITNLSKLIAMEIKSGDLETLIKVMGACCTRTGGAKMWRGVGSTGRLIVLCGSVRVCLRRWCTGGIDEVKRMRDEFDLRIAVLTETAIWLKNNGDQLAGRYDKRIQDALKVRFVWM